MAFDPKKPNAPEPEWEAYKGERTVVDDAVEGTSRIRAKKTVYIPRSLTENGKLWNERVARTVHYGATERALESIVGLIDRHEPVLVDTEGVPPWLDGIVERDTPKGGLASATSKATRHVTTTGMVLIWTSPAWQFIKLSNVLDLVENEEGLVTELRVLVDKDTVWRAVLIGDSTMERTTYRSKDGVWVAEDPMQIPLPVPGLPISHESVRSADSSKPPKPPLTDLAYENILHTQIRSDRNAQLQVSSIPIPVIKGQLPSQQGSNEGQPRPLHVGRKKAVKLGPDGDFKIVEMSGESLGASRQELLDIEMRMGRISISVIDRFVKGAESADSRRIDERQSASSVRTIARTVQAAIGGAVKLSAAWYRGNGAVTDLPKVPVPIATSQASEPPSNDQLRLMAELVEARRLPVDMLWMALERAELLPQGSAFDMKDMGEVDPVPDPDDE